MLSHAEFVDRLRGKCVFGLSREEATAIVDKGRAFADYFEETVLSNMYLTYKEHAEKHSFEDFVRACPLVPTEKLKELIGI